jgi:hypothetical protein
MGERVQWEREDYAYIPQGLMAGDWGKTGHRTEVAEGVREFRLRMRRMMDNDSSRDSLMYIYSLDDATVLAAADEDSPEHREVARRLGGDESYINPSWITGQCATDAYERGLIDEREFDRLADN